MGAVDILVCRVFVMPMILLRGAYIVPYIYEVDVIAEEQIRS
jgi:hypothetical protein